MLTLRGVSVAPPGDNSGEADHFLLRGVSLRFPLGHFSAVVGPSGCGKSTLLKSVAGMLEPVEGELFWRGRDLESETDFHPSELGYVPQFSIFHDRVTVREAVRTATRLRSTKRGRGVSTSEWVDQILERVGLLSIADRRTGVLSGGQQRRLGLALELVTAPALLLCDEVTSGLDPKSEDEIVSLMRNLASDRERLVLSVTHSLRHLYSYDTITVLNAGRLVFHGPPDHLLSFFQVETPEDVFPALAAFPVEYWVDRFGLYRPFEEAEMFATPEPDKEVVEAAASHGARNVMPLPNPLIQAIVLSGRRIRLFLRDPAQIFLQAALILIFPAVVVLFAYEGLPEIRNLSMDMDQNVLEQLRERIEFTIQSSRVGGLVSGLVMFQVILLTLMGANNAAREIANERHIIEKEKLAGVGVLSTLASKCAFLLPLVAVQSFWMTWFVKSVCAIPGGFNEQFSMLFLVNAAMTATGLAISAWARTSEQASLVSIYLVGFQLPLSGTVLALPDVLAPLVRPFIAAYWSWSGYLQALRDTRFYDLVTQISSTPVATPDLASFVLLAHLATAGCAAWVGLGRNRL